MDDQHDISETIHIGPCDRPRLRAFIPVLAALFAGANLFLVYPLGQMIVRSPENAKIWVITILLMGVSITASVAVIQYAHLLTTLKPYLIIEPEKLIYSADGKKLIELPWALMDITHASSLLFRVRVNMRVLQEGRATPPAYKTIEVGIPFDGLERPGAEIVKLLTDRVAAATGAHSVASE